MEAGRARGRPGRARALRPRRRPGDAARPRAPHDHPRLARRWGPRPARDPSSPRCASAGATTRGASRPDRRGRCGPWT